YRGEEEADGDVEGAVRQPADQRRRHDDRALPGRTVRDAGVGGDPAKADAAADSRRGAGVLAELRRRSHAVILSRGDGEGSQLTYFEILRCAQDDGAVATWGRRDGAPPAVETTARSDYCSSIFSIAA